MHKSFEQKKIIEHNEVIYFPSPKAYGSRFDPVFLK